MGVIQQGINQLLGTIAIGAKLSPELETKRELKASETKQKKIIAQIKAIQEAGGEVTEKQIQKLQDELDKQFELDPTTEKYKKTQIISNYNKKIAALKEDEDRRLQAEYEGQMAEAERGQKRAQGKGRKQLKEKIKFENFKEMFTEGGRYK